MSAVEDILEFADEHQCCDVDMVELLDEYRKDVLYTVIDAIQREKLEGGWSAGIYNDGLDAASRRVERMMGNTGE